MEKLKLTANEVKQSGCIHTCRIASLRYRIGGRRLLIFAGEVHCCHIASQCVPADA